MMAKFMVWRPCVVAILLMSTFLAVRGMCLAASGDTVADRVLGQSNFSFHGVNIVKANGMYNPRSVAVDNSGPAPHHLYVADTNNNRVLAWHDAAGFANGSAPDLISGQPNAATVDCVLASDRLCSPDGSQSTRPATCWSQTLTTAGS